MKVSSLLVPSLSNESDGEKPVEPNNNVDNSKKRVFGSAFQSLLSVTREQPPRKRIKKPAVCRSPFPQQTQTLPHNTTTTTVYPNTSNNTYNITQQPHQQIQSKVRDFDLASPLTQQVFYYHSGVSPPPSPMVKNGPQPVQTSRKKSIPSPHQQQHNMQMLSASAGNVIDNNVNATEEDEKEKKRRIRLMKNRQSAALSRKRKKEYVASLESKAKDLDVENSNLKTQVHKLKTENWKSRILIEDQERQIKAFKSEKEDLKEQIRKLILLLEKKSAVTGNNNK